MAEYISGKIIGVTKPNEEGKVSVTVQFPYDPRFTTHRMMSLSKEGRIQLYPDDDYWYDVQTFSIITDISVPTVYRLIKRKILKAVPVPTLGLIKGFRYKITRSEIERFINEQSEYWEKRIWKSVGYTGDSYKQTKKLTSRT